MGDVLTEGVWFEDCKEGERGSALWRSPICEDQRRSALGHRDGAKRRVGAPYRGGLWGLRPMNI